MVIWGIWSFSFESPMHKKVKRMHVKFIILEAPFDCNGKIHSYIEPYEGKSLRGGDWTDCLMRELPP